MTVDGLYVGLSVSISRTPVAAPEWGSGLVTTKEMYSIHIAAADAQ